MSIPVTASSEAFTPACMAEIEGAPTFIFRHAKVSDRLDFQRLIVEEGLKEYSEEDIREAAIIALREGFTSENMEHNITRIRAFWAAIDEFTSAMDAHDRIVDQIRAEHSGEGEPELPPAPVLDFPEDEARAVNELLADVEEAECARPMRKMRSANLKTRYMTQRLLLAMFLKSTSLPVKLTRNDGILSPESVEAVIEGLRKAAEAADVSADLATAQLSLRAAMTFRVDKDEEKNSSSPRSGSSAPKSSASTQSSGPQMETPPPQSSDPATSGADHGSSSSASDNPVSA